MFPWMREGTGVSTWLGVYLKSSLRAGTISHVCGGYFFGINVKFLDFNCCTMYEVVLAFRKDTLKCLGIKEYDISNTILYSFGKICVCTGTQIAFLCCIYNTVIHTHTKREKENNKTNNNWWIWAKDIWKFFVISEAEVASMAPRLERRQSLFWEMDSPVHSVPTFFFFFLLPLAVMYIL